MPDSAGRASVLNVVFSLINLVVGIFVNVAIARLLGPTSKGMLSVFQAAQSILLVAGYSVQQGVIRCVASKRPDWSTLRNGLDFLAFLQAVVLVTVLALLIQHSAARRVLFSGLPNLYLGVLFLAVWGSLWFLFRVAVVAGLQQYTLDAKVNFITGTANNVATVLGLTLLSTWGNLNASSVIIMSAAATVGSNVLIWGFVTRKITISEGTPTTIPQLLRGIIRDAAPMYVRDMLEWTNGRVDVFFVNGFLGPRQVGLYSVAVGLSSQVLQIPSAMIGPLFARVAADEESQETLSLIKFAYRVTLVLSALMALCVLVAVPLLVPLVYGDRYAGSVPLLMLLLPGIVLIAPTRIAVTYLRAQGKLAAPIRAEIVGVILTAVLDSVLIPRYGAIGASIASSCSYTGLSICLTLQFLKISGSRATDLFLLRAEDLHRVLGVVRGFTRRNSTK